MEFDVAIVAGPRVEIFPSPGVRILSMLLSRAGLKVGILGGDDLRPLGVIPAPGSGGTIVFEDSQFRVHEARARAIVKMCAIEENAPYFQGNESEGVLTLATARRLLSESRVLWAPAVAILGSGNRAFQFGSHLLSHGLTREVNVIETHPELWPAKRIAGWEVEARRFRRLGGRVSEAQPLGIQSKGALLWELRVQDEVGVRRLEVGRVIVAGPFAPRPGVREYPAGSFLFEFDQTGANTELEDVEGWRFEEERARWTASRLIRALVPNLGDQREEWDREHRAARSGLKLLEAHLGSGWSPAHQGKWMDSASQRALRDSPSTPKSIHSARRVASLECVEAISCRACVEVCPEGAIQRTEAGLVLNEDQCTACGKCLPGCPSRAPVLLHEGQSHGHSEVVLPLSQEDHPKAGDTVTALNRRGEVLAKVRVKEVIPDVGVALLIPSALLWEARGYRSIRKDVEDEVTANARLAESHFRGERVEIQLDGERRLVREGLPLSVALFEIGRARPEDRLLCSDESCRRCEVMVDGVRKRGCSERIRRGQVVLTQREVERGAGEICPCLKLIRKQVEDRLRAHPHTSIESVLKHVNLGSGRCHGAECVGELRELIRGMAPETVEPELRVAAQEWIDWRFPWIDWTLQT